MQREARNCHYNQEIIISTPSQFLRHSKTELNNNVATSNYRYLPITNYAPIPMMTSRGPVLGSVQGGTNKCVRQGAKESGQICTSYEQFELGNFDVA